MSADVADVTPGSQGLYRGLRALLVGACRSWFRLEVHGSENVPRTGAFILAPGAHRSILDTPIVAATTTRMLRYMGAEKYFEAPGLGLFLKSVGGFPVERDFTDRQALRVAEDILNDGQPLVVFPEASRYEGPIVQPLREGAAFMACRTGAPIVCVGIGGAERALPKKKVVPRPRKVVLVVGEPLLPPVVEPGARTKRSQVRELTDRMHTQTQDLFDEAQIRAGAY